MKGSVASLHFHMHCAVTSVLARRPWLQGRGVWLQGRVMVVVVVVVVEDIMVGGNDSICL